MKLGHVVVVRVRRTPPPDVDSESCVLKQPRFATLNFLSHITTLSVMFHMMDATSQKCQYFWHKLCSSFITDLASMCTVHSKSGLPILGKYEHFSRKLCTPGCHFSCAVETFRSKLRTTHAKAIPPAPMLTRCCKQLHNVVRRTFWNILPLS